MIFEVSKVKELFLKSFVTSQEVIGLFCSYLYFSRLKKNVLFLQWNYQPYVTFKSNAVIFEGKWEKKPELRLFHLNASHHPNLSMYLWWITVHFGFQNKFFKTNILNHWMSSGRLCSEEKKNQPWCFEKISLSRNF